MKKQRGRPVTLTQLKTGVPGLDEVLGGGVPKYSFNVISGEPGTGKTTLAHQILSTHASASSTALYFTALGESPMKVLRYQQQMALFDPAQIGTSIRFVDLSREISEGDLNAALTRIQREVAETQAELVVLDSFRSVAGAGLRSSEKGLALEDFVHRLALHLAAWQVTSFLLGEYASDEVNGHPLFTVADGTIWLSQLEEGNSVVRKLQVKKLRGQASMAGLHAFRISSEGLQVFPRVANRPPPARRGSPIERLASGVPGLDEMLNGGFIAGDSTLLAGPSGVGKTVFATQYIAAAARHGEPSVLVAFEEQPDDYFDRAQGLGIDLAGLVDAGKVKILYLRLLDMSA